MKYKIEEGEIGMHDRYTKKERYQEQKQKTMQSETETIQKKLEYS